MTRLLNFANSGIVDGDTMRQVVEFFPNVKGQFRQRKTYDEYYYDSTIVVLTLDIIEKISNIWNVIITPESFVIDA